MFKQIRTKLAVVVAIPLVILLGVASLEVVASLDQSRAVSSQSDLATIAIGPGGLVANLQTERNQASLQLVGFDSKVALGVATAAEARRRVDRSATAFQQSLSVHSAVTAKPYQAALLELAHLQGLRAQLDGFRGVVGTKSPETTALATSLFNGYTAILQTFFDATSRIAGTVENSQLRSGIELLDISTRQQESESLAIRDALLASFSGGLKSDGSLTAFATDLANYRNWTQRLSVLGTASYPSAVTNYVAGQPTIQLQALLGAYLAGAPIDSGVLLTTSNAGVAPGPNSVTAGAQFQKQLGSLVSDQAGHLRSSARLRLILFMLLALTALGLAVAIVILASRSITRPLRRLAEQADAMTRAALPAAVQSILDTPLGEDVVVPVVPPITVSTHDEVAAVAAALTAVQDSAVNLAVEQAVLRRNIADSFVNLGRRNQNLLGRQLDFISALEQKETEPDKLDELFRLDHLATRMRRNAESLLVLAGLESPRQWSAPVAVGDVVRASLAEVEDYQRVSVRQIDATALPGSLAADLAHILAELIENAIASSPPDTPVEVYGRLSEQDYMIVVVDRGVGMSRPDLERANRRLAGTESFTVAPSRYLGHYVAGHLASRYGLAVALQESDAGGIKAKVSVPISVLDQARPGPIQPPAVAVGADSPGGGIPRDPTGWMSGPAAAKPATWPAEPAPAIPRRAAPPAEPSPVSVSASVNTANGRGPAPLTSRNGAVAAVSPPAVAPLAVARAADPAPPLIERPARGVGEQDRPDESEGLTSSGLARRVPGASIGDVDDDLLLRRDVDEPSAGDTSAHEVYRMLSSLWSDPDAKSPPRASDRPGRGGEA